MSRFGENFLIVRNVVDKKYHGLDMSDLSESSGISPAFLQVWGILRSFLFVECEL
jgi:hypothetical protein